MAEPVSLASGLLALATFAFQSTIKLYETIQSFRSHPSHVRELLNEVEALRGVLGPLSEAISTTTDIDLSALDLPLLRCGNACREFEQEILKFSSQPSAGNWTNFRDWAKLKYMGDNIDGFRRLLAGYKSTINIALTDANLRKSSDTAENIEKYKDLIETAKTDLEAQLESIDERLELLLGQTVAGSDPDASELRRIKEEKLSTEKCLQICSQLSDRIDLIQPIPERNGNSPGPHDPGALPERVTNEGLQECKNSLILTVAKLERHMQDVMSRLLTKSRGAMASDEEITDLERLRDQWETARQCMDICTRADSNLKENISKIDNYATGDAVQFMVSTNGKVLHGSNRGLGWRTRQVGGYLNDVSVQQISRDMVGVNFQSTTRNENSSSRDDIPSVPDDGMGNESLEFRERHGPGFVLTPKASPDVQMTSTAFDGGLPS